MGRQANMLTWNTCVPRGTFFSQEKFVEAVARAGTPDFRVLKLQGTRSPAHLFGLERIRKYNRRSVWLAPFGLPAYPSGGCRLDESVPHLLARLKSPRTADFEWNVRFDHGDLAKKLNDAGLHCVESTTQVLYLDRPYGDLFRRFSETARNKVRRAERKGVLVHRATEQADLTKYYALYQKVGIERKWGSIYSKSLLGDIFSLNDNVVLLIAKLNDLSIGGGLFIRDGDSFFYWQGAMNYEYKSYFPHYAIINSAIHFASEEGKASFNMGASLGIPTLEQFKSFWGAVKVPHWQFIWHNPIWSFVSRCHSKLRAKRRMLDQNVISLETARTEQHATSFSTRERAAY
jgi:hypothetical protein